MTARLSSWLSPPEFDGDAEKTSLARLLNAVLIGLIPLLSLLAGSAMFILFGPTDTRSWLLLVLVSILAAIWLLMRRGFVRLATFATLAILWLGFTGLL